MKKIKKIVKHITVKSRVIIAAFAVVIIAVSLVFWFGYSRISALFKETASLNEKTEDLSKQINDISTYLLSLESEFASTTVLLEENIAKTGSNLKSAIEKKSQSLEDELGSVKSEVGGISGTVTTLEKLSKTDPELLQKYSKVFFLNEHYEPARLVEVPDDYKYSEKKNLLVHDKVWPNLENMLSDALKDNVKIYVFSAFRSFGTQEALKGQYTVIYGQGTANQFSADQGYSEHQLGTTVDLITTGIGGTLAGFDGTEAYTWLQNNAYKHGFVLSYPKGNAYYIFEPWHWRYVGVKLATELHVKRKNFYDMDQREIDEYLVDIFD